MVCENLGESAQDALLNAREWSQLEIVAGDFSFYAVTATPSAEVESISSELSLGYHFMAGDEIMLKTIIRSNPGFVLLKDGIILGKWGWRDFPTLEQLDPQWSELIGNASAPLDEEQQILQDAGVYDDFSFEVVEFDHFLPALLLNQGADKREKGVVLAFLLALMVIILLSGRISPVKV